MRNGDREHWWSKRLITVLESFGYGPRLARGRGYARSGAVQELDRLGGGHSQATREATSP